MLYTIASDYNVLLFFLFIKAVSILVGLIQNYSCDAVL
jgi:hypothetical protein